MGKHRIFARVSRLPFIEDTPACEAEFGGVAFKQIGFGNRASVERAIAAGENNLGGWVATRQISHRDQSIRRAVK